MKCRVIYDYKHSYGWECPICKMNHISEDLRKSLFDCGISEEELKGNLQFWKFVKGIDDASIDGRSSSDER